MKVRLRQVEGFLAVAETLSFSRAAERIGMTQPAFSQMIRELEEILGLKLLERTTRRVRLTNEGRQLIEQMRRAVTELDDACRSAQAMARLDQGRLAIAVLPSMAGGGFMKALAAFSASYPGISIHVREEHNARVLEKLESYEVELAVCSRAPVGAAFEFEELFVDELVCILPRGHRLAAGASISWRRLAAETVIMVSASSAINQVMRANLAQFGRGKTAEYETLHAVTALNMARAGLGVTLVPTVALPELNMDGLTHRRMGRPRPLRSIGIYRRAGRPLSPSAARFREMLLAHLKPGQAAH